jgi:predicted nucleic acid-binding protein
MEYEMVLQLDRQDADLDVGLADLSVVVLARRFGTRRLLTLDERHVWTLRPLDGGTFTLLPADERLARN